MCIIYFGALDNSCPFVRCHTMKCFCYPQEDASPAPWDALSPADQTFLRDKYPDAGQGAVCDLCICSAPVCKPQFLFFSRRSSSASSSATQSINSGLQVPLAPRIVSGAATYLATESLESGVVQPSASVAESSPTATGSVAHPPSTS